MHILFPDTWHFKPKNFPSLFAYLKQSDARITREKSQHGWWKAHGDYRAFQHRLPTIETLGSIEDITALEHRGISLWTLARSEFLCLVLTQPDWYCSDCNNTDQEILARVIEQPATLETLSCCLAAAKRWVTFWHDLLERKQDVTHIAVFSGAYIYTRALLAVAEQRDIKAFCLEHFFTGNEYYLEPRYTPLPNASQLAEMTPAPPSGNTKDRFLDSAWTAFRLQRMRNKNVKASHQFLAPIWQNGKPTVLILGQVLNDFSLLETRDIPLASISFYTRLIRRLLEATEVNILFKAHPWERKRHNVRQPLTLNEIREFRETLPAEWKARLRVYEAEPVKALMAQSDHCVALCSQGLLEACLMGIKPAQFGKAFFGGKGFTEDFTDIDTFIDWLRHTPSATLTLSEYDRFEQFMNQALNQHLIAADETNLARVGRRLALETEDSATRVNAPPVTAPLPFKASVRDFIDFPQAASRELYYVSHEKRRAD